MGRGLRDGKWNMPKSFLGTFEPHLRNPVPTLIKAFSMLFAIILKQSLADAKQSDQVCRQELADGDERVLFQLRWHPNETAGLVGGERDQLSGHAPLRNGLRHASRADAEITEVIFTSPHQKQTEDYITGRFG